MDDSDVVEVSEPVSLDGVEMKDGWLYNYEKGASSPPAR